MKEIIGQIIGIIAMIIGAISLLQKSTKNTRIIMVITFIAAPRKSPCLLISNGW